MSERANRNDALRVGLCVEQLRRAVPGGIGTYGLGLIQGLVELSNEGLVAPRLVASRSRAKPDPLAAIGLPISIFGGRLKAMWWDRGPCRLDLPVDVVHAISIATPRVDVPLSATVHDLAWRVVPEAFPAHGRRWHDAALARVARRCAAVIVPSSVVADQLVSADVGIDRDAIRVIEEGADHLPAPDDVATKDLLEALGVATAYILAVGTIEPRKNLPRLIEAYGRARSSFGEPCALVVVGPTGWGPALGPAGEGVVFAGRVEAPLLAGLYARARCVAYTPLVEGFGLPVVEAMHAKVPVVSSDVPAAGGATELVDANDVEAITKGLLHVTEDEARQDELRRLGAVRAGALTWRATARSHLEVWREMHR